MKKFSFKAMMEGIRSSLAPPPPPPPPPQPPKVPENLRPEHFNVRKTFKHGFPYQPTVMAFDPVQRVLAIGTKTGGLKLLGKPGVDAYVKHPTDSAVIQLQFLINEGALISATADDTIHLWNFRQKLPRIAQTLKFQKERITCIHLPLQSKWLYVGTERGNIHILHIETFALSAYIINWNKAIEISRKTHPGSVIHVSDNPLDFSKMLIGYETGQIVFWDLKLRTADYRCHTDESLESVSWHHEGKQFMCSHSDGSLTTWTVRQLEPSNVTYPHAKTTKDGETEPCKPVQKVEWKVSRSGEAHIIFCGGLPYDTSGKTSSITVVHGKTTTVLQMEHHVIDFITLCESPWTSDYQEPYAVAVLLQYDLVVIDLLSAGCPCFENPYPMHIHESPVTCCAYFADCPADFIPALYSVGLKAPKKTKFSDKDWPISGGQWSSNVASYSETIVTGHADGSVKFWDASASTLQHLYKLKTAKLFEKSKMRSVDTDEDPLAIQLIYLCLETRKLAIAGSGRHAIVFDFKTSESVPEVVTLEIALSTDTDKRGDNSSNPDSPATNTPANVEAQSGMESNHAVKVKSGLHKSAPGFQPSLICLTVAANDEGAKGLTVLTLHSTHGLMAYGNDTILALVDIVQKTSLIVLNTAEMGTGADLYQRATRSPKKHDDSQQEDDDRPRSHSTDQVQDSPAVSHDSKFDSDKSDESFQRLRSASMSSLDNITTETISCLTFADSYIKRNDPNPCLTLWIGTSMGSVRTVLVNLPAGSERYANQAAVAKFEGPNFKLKGSILSMSFLNFNNAASSYSHESYEDENTENKDGHGSTDSQNNAQVPEDIEDCQFVVLASEKQAMVATLPSQTCFYHAQLGDTCIAIKTEIVYLKEDACLVCYLSNGHLVTYSLPSLRQLIDVDFLPVIDLRIAKTICISSRGNGVYLSSPTEIQKFSVLNDFGEELTEMMADLFITCAMPESPKESFLKGLFGGGIRGIDREGLFSETRGAGSRAVAEHIPGPNAGMEGLRRRATTAAGEVNMAHQMMVERGEKLSQLEERTGRMMTEAEGFSHSAHGLMLKYKDKKWYQL